MDVSDETLEIAGGAAKINASFTLGSCTGLFECPGCLSFGKTARRSSVLANFRFWP
jgi:hypothetical protein